MKIALDFDGTVVDFRHPAIGDEVPEAVFYLRMWQEAGAKLMLWTVRSNEPLKSAVMWFRDRGIKLHGINENPDQKYWAQGPKMYAEMYVDDAAFGAPLIHPAGFKRPCLDWSVVGPEVLRILEEQYIGN